MAYPLINPSHQFVDTSGSPIVGGTVEFRNPTTNDLINTYPTADDANAQTNQNDNPFTLDSRGGFTGIYLEDGVPYKITIKDAAGATVDTQDDVLCPVGTKASIGLVTNFRTAAEISAGITPTDYSFVAAHILRYGENTTPGTTNMTTAVSNAVLVAEVNGDDVTGVAGTYLCNVTIIAKMGFNFPPGVIFKGATSSPVVTCQADGVALRGGLTCDGATTSLNGWFHEGANNCDIQNLTVKNNTGDGLYGLGVVGNGTYYNQFTGLLSRDNGTDNGGGTDGATVATTNFSSSSYTFTSSDVGRRVIIHAGTDEGSHLITYFVDANNVTVNETFAATTSSITFSIHSGSGVKIKGRGLESSGTDGVTVTSTNFSSASYTFSSSDVGRKIYIPTGPDQGLHKITAFVNSNNVTVSVAFTATTSSIPFEIHSGERANVWYFSGAQVTLNKADGFDVERAVGTMFDDCSVEQNRTGYGYRFTGCTKACASIHGGWIETDTSVGGEGGIFVDVSSRGMQMYGTRINIANSFAGAGIGNTGNVFMVDDATGVLTRWMQTIGQNIQSPYIITPQQITVRLTTKNANHTVSALDSGQTFHLAASGPSDVVTATLPAAVTGLRYKFIRGNLSHKYRIDPVDGTEVIRNAGTAGGGGKYLSLDTNHGAVEIECAVTGVWEITSLNGGTITFEA